MKADVAVLWRLLAPHARKRLWLFGGILALGTAAASVERSVLLLLEPTFDAVFGVTTERAPSGGESAAGPVAEEAADPAPMASLVEPVEEARRSLIEGLLGTARPVTDAERIDVLWRIALTVVVLALLAAAFQYAFTWLTRKVALDVVVELRVRVTRHLMRLSMTYHDQRQLGDLLSRISSDVSVTLNVLNDGLRNLVLEPLMALTSLVLAFFMAPVATLGMVLGLPLVVLPVTLLGRKVRRRSRQSMGELGASVQNLTQMFQGIRTVKAFRAEERELDAFQRSNQRFIHQSMRMVRALALTNSWTLVLTHAGLGAVILLVGYLTVNGMGAFASGGGGMVAFFVLLAQTYNHVKKATRQWTRVQESLGAAERLQEVLDVPEDILDRPGAHALDGLGAGIRLEGVSFRYPGAGASALEAIDLELRPGETLALVGASGAGKSTLIDLLARFRDPTEGRITVDGHDLRDVTLDSWTSHYAMVGQTPFLFHATVRENIAYGRPEATREEIEAAARAADIHRFIESLPEGYDTDVAEMGSRLSGGQRQRLTIARAIVKGAPLLLLDEATSALDTETEINVQQALDVLCEGRTVVVIAHRLSTIRSADRIAVLDHGRLVELGSHEELLERNGVYARLHAAQFAGAGIEG